MIWTLEHELLLQRLNNLCQSQPSREKVRLSWLFGNESRIADDLVVRDTDVSLLCGSSQTELKRSRFVAHCNDSSQYFFHDFELVVRIVEYTFEGESPSTMCLESALHCGDMTPPAESGDQERAASLTKSAPLKNLHDSALGQMSKTQLPTSPKLLKKNPNMILASVNSDHSKLPPNMMDQASTAFSSSLHFIVPENCMKELFLSSLKRAGEPEPLVVSVYYCFHHHALSLSMFKYYRRSCKWRLP